MSDPRFHKEKSEPMPVAILLATLFCFAVVACAVASVLAAVLK